MAETADKALDLADKWAQQIGQKLSDAAPGAADVAREAVAVQIISTILSWCATAACVVIIFFIVRYLLSQTKNYFDERRDEYSEGAIPFFIGSVVGGVVGGILLTSLFVKFPAREIAGIFAPRGYVALMMLDVVKK